VTADFQHAPAEQVSKRYLEGIDAELELSSHAISELELDVASSHVGQRDEAPAVDVVVDLDQLADVRLAQVRSRHALLADPGRHEVEQRTHDHVLDSLHVLLVRQVHAEDQVQVIVYLSIKQSHL